MTTKLVGEISNGCSNCQYVESVESDDDRNVQSCIHSDRRLIDTDHFWIKVLKMYILEGNCSSPGKNGIPFFTWAAVHYMTKFKMLKRH